MKRSSQPPIYSMVAYDIAVKIAAGELKETERFSGRSIMSSQYGVSPETIRRAIRLLSDVGIVSVQNNVGNVVLSKDRAAEYVEQYKIGHDLMTLKNELDGLMHEQVELNNRVTQVIQQITDLSNRFKSSDRLRTYEIKIERGSNILGKSIGDLEFRQKTGATIVAIKHEDEITLSPAPATIIRLYDTLVIVCDITRVGKVTDFIG